MLLVAVNGFELQVVKGTEGSAGKVLKPGELWWSDSAAAVINAGSGPARFVMLEF
jgi:hypothetical protein